MGRKGPQVGPRKTLELRRLGRLGQPEFTGQSPQEGRGSQGTPRDLHT